MLEAPVFPEDVDVSNDVLYSPKVYNLYVDKDILWQCPGYDVDSGETHKYGCVGKGHTGESGYKLWWKLSGQELR
jgi:hypothetical protein